MRLGLKKLIRKERFRLEGNPQESRKLGASGKTLGDQKTS